MLALEWKGRALIEKVNSKCFCWFPAAILVHQNGTPIWRLHTGASLRSKRFHSSYSAKFGAGAKKKWKALVPIFSTNSRGTACYAGYTGAWNVSANNSETVCQKDLRLGHIVDILVFYSISFSWLFPLDGFQFILLLRDSENDLFPQIFPQKNAQKTARNAQLVPRVFSFSNMASRFHRGEPGAGSPGGGKYIAHFGKEW